MTEAQLKEEKKDIGDLLCAEKGGAKTYVRETGDGDFEILIDDENSGIKLKSLLLRLLLHT